MQLSLRETIAGDIQEALVKMKCFYAINPRHERVRAARGAETQNAHSLSADIALSKRHHSLRLIVCSLGLGRLGEIGGLDSGLLLALDAGGLDTAAASIGLVAMGER